MTTLPIQNRQRLLEMLLSASPAPGVLGKMLLAPGRSHPAGNPPNQTESRQIYPGRSWSWGEHPMVAGVWRMYFVGYETNTGVKFGGQSG